MDSSRKTEVVVGLVSLLGTLLLIAGILIGEGFTYDPSKKVILLRLDHSGGLEAGAPVVVNGVKRGEVTSVGTDDGTVLAKLEIDNTDDLMSDASALVSILEITGGRKVEIFKGSSGTPFDGMKEIKGRTAADLSSLVTTLGDVSQDLVTLLHRMDTLTAVITRVMGDSTFAEDVQNLAHDGALLMRSTREWVENNKSQLTEAVKEMRATLNSVKTAIDKNEPTLAATLEKLDQRLTEIEVTVQKADNAIDNIDSLSRNVNGIVNDIRSNDGLMHAVLYDPHFKKSLDTLQRRFERLVEQIRQTGVNVNVGLGHRP